MNRAVLSAAILAVAAFPAVAQDLSADPGEPLDVDRAVTRAECERFNRLHGTEISCGGLPEDVGVVSGDLCNGRGSIFSFKSHS